MSAALTSSLRAAASTKSLRTSAHAARIAAPPCSIDRLPAVYHSSGEAEVSPATMTIRSGATSSSSAAICAIAVTVPWPSSTLPEKTRTVPGGSMRTQRSRRGFALRLAGNISPDGAKDAHMGAAPAEMALQGLEDFFFRRFIERGNRHQDSIDAVAALRRLFVQKRLLQRVGSRRCAEPLDRRDFLADSGPERRIAGLDGAPLHHHGTRAAVAGPAAEARTLEAEIVAQGVDERRRRIGLRLAGLA